MAIIKRSYNQEMDLDAIFRVLEGGIDSANIKDGSIVNVDISSTAAIDITKTTLNSSAARHDLYVQSKTTNALTPNQIIYRGWSFVVGNGGAGVTKQVTLPNSGFDDTNYTVVAMYVGAKNGSDPTTVVDTGSNPNNIAVYTPGTAAQSATAFTVQITDTDGVVLNAIYRFVFMWLAIGTKA